MNWGENLIFLPSSVAWPGLGDRLKPGRVYQVQAEGAPRQSPLSGLRSRKGPPKDKRESFPGWLFSFFSQGLPS